MNEGEAQVDDIPALRFLSAANRDALNGFQEFRSVIMDEGALPSKEKLLIALACTGGSGFAFASMVLEVEE